MSYGVTSVVLEVMALLSIEGKYLMAQWGKLTRG